MKIRFNLALKFLLPLNLVVLVVWVGFAYWNLKSLEAHHIQAEVQAIKQLGLGLRTAVQQTVQGKTSMAQIQKSLDQLAAEQDNLDIMVIGRDFKVLAATYRNRTGKRWFESDIQAVLEGRVKVIWKTASHMHEGHRAFDTTIGVFDSSGRPIYAIHIARRLDLVERAMRAQIRRDILFSVIIFVVIALAVNALVYFFVIRRLDRMLDRVAGTEWSHEEDMPRSGDEVTQLDTALSRMMDRIIKATEDLRQTISEKDRLLSEVQRLKASLADEVERVRTELTSAHARIVRLERQSAQAELTGILAHEVRNPLHIIRGTAEVLARRVEAARPLARDIMDEVDRVEHLIRELFDLSRPTEPKIEEFSVQQFFEDVAATATKARRHPSASQDHAVDIVAPPGLKILGDPFLLKQALVNYLDNAMEVTPRGKAVYLEAAVTEKGILFSVRDHGRGLTPEAAERAFEPFFTMKQEGIGLGLAIVNKVATLHGGSAKLEPWQDGTEARLIIPQPPQPPSGSWTSLADKGKNAQDPKQTTDSRAGSEDRP
ncbi:MAG: HAMP domain-containing histidine kinase [Deltaproteobacteria bacterium]|nr:HAMP domain-containing histidine kinase [Deltaproteobacteria bacterium]